MRRVVVGLLGLAVVVGVGSASAPAAPGPTSTETLFGSAVPSYQADSDKQGWELGTTFSSTIAGSVSALRFLKLDSTPADHTASLWDAAGRRLSTVTFRDSGTKGWQTATLGSPVALTPGATYTASFSVPSGTYAVVPKGLSAPFSNGHLRVPANGGKFSATVGTMPSSSYNANNYLIDVVFGTSWVDGGGATPRARQLPRVPWEGGPAYSARFSGSNAFANPNVFPIGIWWGDFDSDANVKWDKAHGINFYTQLNGTEDGRLIANNDMYVVQGADSSQLVRNLPFSDPHWVGWWLSDETDGRYDPPSSGQAQIQKELDAQRSFCPSGACKFSYANYTYIVTSYFNDTQVAADEKYVNMVPGAVSVDGYYYTDPSCSDPNRVDYQVNAPDNAHCATSAAYGNMVRTLRMRDAADGRLQPLWGFVENGAPGGNGKYITPDQMKGAVMSEVIHEARGIVWFNQSFSGSCQSGNVLRDAEANPSGCNAARVEAMKQVNLQLQSLAPVLNTQSFVWDFGARGIDTMLKITQGYAYVFSGVGLNADPGTRTFRLPSGISGTSVEVVGENRSLPITGGTFTDTFAKEYSYHIYKVKM